MLPYLYQILRSYAPIITLPVAIIIGAVGYNIENMISENKTPNIESVEEKRRKRQLEKGSIFISSEFTTGPSSPRTVLDKNLPPSLSTDSER